MKLVDDIDYDNPLNNLKNEHCSCRKKVAKELLFYVIVFVVTLILFLVVKPLYLIFEENFAHILACLAVLAAVIVCIVMALKNKLTTKRIIILMIIAGLALRIGYMLATPSGNRHNDVYTIWKNSSHFDYAWTIFSTGALPTTNVGQFYHPPLNPLIQAVFMKIIYAFSSLFSVSESFVSLYSASIPSDISEMQYFLYSTCEILCVLYSVITMIVEIKILKKLGFKGWALVGTSAIVIFFPRNIQFAGSLNNDPLSYMFSMLALYYAIRWWKDNKSLGNIIAIAIFVGLGMMTKFSSATICLPIAGIFIYEFVRTLRHKENSLSLKKMILEYSIFLLIAAVIGLWFTVYAFIRFGQGLGYVVSPTIIGNKGTSSYSLFERFIFSKEEIFNVYISSETAHNIFCVCLRTALFGLFSYRGIARFVVAIFVVFFANFAVIILAIALVKAVYLFFKYDRKNKNNEMTEEKKNLFLTFLLVESQVLSEIYFYIKMPFTSTMDFRYIMPLILGITLIIGFVCKVLAKHDSISNRILKKTVIVSGVLLLIFSSIFYLI